MITHDVPRPTYICIPPTSDLRLPFPPPVRFLHKIKCINCSQKSLEVFSVWAQRNSCQREPNRMTIFILISSSFAYFPRFSSSPGIRHILTSFNLRNKVEFYSIFKYENFVLRNNKMVTSP